MRTERDVNPSAHGHKCQPSRRVDPERRQTPPSKAGLGGVERVMRLRRFYGSVASDQNRSILRFVTGEKLLELGCGYGTLLRDAAEGGKDVLGFDIDFDMLKMAGNLYPSIATKVVQGDMIHLPFKDKTFHTIVFRESLHHVSWEKMLPEALRVCKKEIIVFEPNPNWVVRWCRRIISHEDQEIPLDPLLAQLKRHGVLIEELRFRDLFAFPLSGGFVGREWVPPIRILFPFLLYIDRMFQSFLCRVGIGKWVSWRYLVRGTLREPENRI